VTVRITQGMSAAIVLADIQTAAERLSKLQQKLSSGKELLAPSDNPYGVTRALQLRSDLEANRQYQRNAGDANDWHAVTDTTLSHISELVLRARDLVVQGATDTLGPAGRQAIISEFTQLVDSVKTEANTKVAGRFVFAGSATLTQPYATGATDTYSGNTDAMRREIGPGVQIDLNVNGSAAIGDASTGLLKAMRDVITHLGAGDTASLQSVDLGAITAAADGITNLRAEVGTRQMRLDTATARLQQIEQTQNELLSTVEDADMAKTYVDFSTQQSVYQAALKAGSQVIQPSLLDFLR